MDREILFRGKRINDGNGKWLEGFYYKMREITSASEDYERHPVPVHHYILFERMTDWELPNELYQVEVDPETVCQYTGLTDKNGRKIFEGDIVEVTEGSLDCDNGKGNVIFYDGSWYVDGEPQDSLYDLNIEDHEIKVVGNIFDNPELIGE